MKYDINTLNDYIKSGLIVKNTHNSLPIAVYNYTRKCQLEGAWDLITLNMRGTVLDAQGNTIALSFPKFFNMEELDVLPNGDFETFEKMDGSLGLLFNYNNEWLIATRSSFHSVQGLKALEIINEYRFNLLSDKDCYEIMGFKPMEDYTLIGEIIYPENRIVVDYGNKKEFILLGIINKNTGSEVSYEVVKKIASCLEFPIVKKYDDIKDYTKLKSIIKANQEGFVIKFATGVRMKIKGIVHYKLSKEISNFSTISIWEHLKSNGDLNQFLGDIPDEFDGWVRKVINKLLDDYIAFENIINKDFDSLLLTYNRKLPERKIYSKFVQSKESWKHPILYNMYDGKDYSEYIWNKVTPIYKKPTINEN